MKNKGITLVSLVVTIIVLILLAGISLNLTLGENGILNLAKKARENIVFAQIAEETKLNELYLQMITEGEISGEFDYDAIVKLNEFKRAIADYIEEAGGIKPDFTADKVSFGESIKGIVTEVTKDATATEGQIIEGKTAWVKGSKIIGTMKNNGELNGTLNCNQSYTIPAGFTSGGSITANSLASQTQATATSLDIAEGKTAWINGNKVSGEGKISKSSYTILNTITTSVKAASPTASYTIAENGTYLFLLFNSAYNGFSQPNGRITVNGTEMGITQLAHHLPLYDRGMVYITNNAVNLKKGDVVTGYLTASSSSDWNNICSLIPIKF